MLRAWTIALLLAASGLVPQPIRMAPPASVQLVEGPVRVAVAAVVLEPQRADAIAVEAAAAADVDDAASAPAPSRTDRPGQPRAPPDPRVAAGARAGRVRLGRAKLGRGGASDHVERRRRRARRSLSWFVRFVAWPVLNPGVTLVWTPAHEAICAHLEAFAPGDRYGAQPLVINCPPRIGKSTIITIAWPAWLWLHRPELRFFTVSHSLPQSIKLNADRRILLESLEYKALKPGWSFDNDRHDPVDPEADFETLGAADLRDVRKTARKLRRAVDIDWTLVKGRNVKVSYYNTSRGCMRAVSTTSKLTGDHCDIAVIDDPIDAGTQGISEAALNAWFDDFYVNKFMTRFRADPRVVMVMQRLAANDPSERFLRELNADHLHIAMEYMAGWDCCCTRPPGAKQCVTKLGWTDPRKIEGQLLDERIDEDGELVGGGKIYSREALALNKLNARKYLTQFQQLVTDKAGGILKEAWWRRWDDLDPRGRWLMTVDTSGGGASAKAAYMVLQVQHLGLDGKVRIVDTLRLRAKTMETRHALDLMLERWARVVPLVLVEAKALGLDVLDSWVRVYSLPDSCYRGQFRGVVPETSYIEAGLPNKATKEQRVDSWFELAQAGHIELPTVSAMRPSGSLPAPVDPRILESAEQLRYEVLEPARLAAVEGNAQRAMAELALVDIPLVPSVRDEQIELGTLDPKFLDAYLRIRSVAISLWSPGTWPAAFVKEANGFPHGFADQIDCLGMALLLEFRGLVGHLAPAPHTPSHTTSSTDHRSIWERRRAGR